jgi:hypothetical protein
MRRRDANEAAKGLFGDTGLAWEEYDAGATRSNRVFKIGLLDDNRVFRTFGMSCESYAAAFDYAVASIAWGR